MEQEQKEQPQTEEKKSGMSYAVMGVVVAIVVIVGVIVFAQSRKQSGQQQTKTPASSTEEEKADVIVDFTDSGFSPQSVTIKAGQAVEFENKSSGNMWVASAPHPTHTDYPGFDAKRNYGPGEDYFFTFDKVGTWKYHNHENPPTKFGSVTVE